MSAQNNFNANDLSVDKISEIKPLNHRDFECISLGERYILWQRFISFYNKIQSLEVCGKIYKIAYFLKDENYAEFYEHTEQHKILLDYFYSLLKSYIKCVDVLVTNQQYATLIADSLNRPVFWIKDKFAKEQKHADELLQKCKQIIQLPVNFDIKKNIEEFLKKQKPNTQIFTEELLNANPFPEVDIALDKPALNDDKNNINLVFITDENYAMMTAVAIKSALATKKEESFYEINIIGHCLSKTTKMRFALLEETGSKIQIINIDDLKKFEGIKQERYITPTALLKFDLPEIFADKDKVLYLDGDIFVQGDLREFYNTNIDDNYGAVVKSAALLKPEFHEKQSVCNNDNYFNSGVLLLNLKKMRQDNISQKLLEWRKYNGGYFMDQDAFNAVLSPNVKEMSCWYNFLTYYPRVFPNADLEKFYNVRIPKNTLKAYKKALILHYPGKTKPYMVDMGYLSATFFKYLNRTEFKK